MRSKLGPVMAFVLAISVVLLNGCTDANLRKARQYQSEKKYDQAIQYYKLAVEKDGGNRSARYGLIETYSQKIIDEGANKITPEQVEQVMAELRPIAQPLMSDPNIKRYISMIYQMVAKRYAEEGRDDKVAEAWGKVIEIEPSFAEAHFNLGVALTKAGKIEEAIPHFEKAIELNPYFVKGYEAMGNALAGLGRNDEALKQYMKALELNPDDPAIHYGMGGAYYQSGNKAKAIEEYEKALELEPSYLYAYKPLLDLYKKAGDKKKVENTDKRWKEATAALIKARKEAPAADSSTEPSENL